MAVTDTTRTVPDTDPDTEAAWYAESVADCDEFDRWADDGGSAA